MEQNSSAASLRWTSSPYLVNEQLFPEFAFKQTAILPIDSRSSMNANRHNAARELAMGLSHVIESDPQKAILLSQLPNRYKFAYGVTPNFKEFGFRKLVELLNDFPTLFRVVGEPSGGHQMVFSQRAHPSHYLSEQDIANFATFLASFPEGLLASDISKASLTMYSQPLRCEEFGFNTMLEFLHSIPHVARIVSDQAQLYVFPVVVNQTTPPAQRSFLDQTSLSQSNFASPSTAIINFEAEHYHDVWGDSPTNNNNNDNGEEVKTKLKTLTIKMQAIIAELMELQAKRMEFQKRDRLHPNIAILFDQRQSTLETNLKTLEQQRLSLEFQRHRSGLIVTPSPVAVTLDCSEIDHLLMSTASGFDDALTL